ncbi:MAG: TRAP transporter substrate-binding protein [Deltaproteobacteria bacterium]|nr:TRAP transporter substrate-binding protein [Deltaproteobacteria bacterium]
MKKVIFFTSLLLVFALSACSSKPTTTLTYSIFFPPTHSQVKVATDWAQEIEKRTKGEIKINILSGGSLTPAHQCYDGVVKGISDIGMSAFAYTKGRFPVMEALDLPLGYSSGKVATRVANQFFAKQNPAELNEVKVLYLHAHGPGLLHTAKPIKTLRDLKGQKIRATGSSASIITSLGGVAVAMPQGETYEALKRGVVDGTIGPIEVLKGWKQAEVIKSTTDCSAIGYTTAFFVVMNKQKWDGLSAEAQRVFLDVSAEFIDKHGEAWDADDVIGRQYTIEKGNGIVSLDATEVKRWEKAVQPITAEYAKGTQLKGLPGVAILADLREFIKAETAK